MQSLLEPVLAIGKGYLYCVISKFFLISQRITPSKGRDDVSPEANHLSGLEVALKSGISEETAQKLVSKGHSVVSAPPESFGGAQVSLVHSESGIFMGGSDPQKDSCAIAF